MTNFQSELGIRGQVQSVEDVSRELRRMELGRSVQPFTPSWIRFTIRAADAQAILNTAGAVFTYDHPWEESIGHACVIGGGFDTPSTWTPAFGSGSISVQIVDGSGVTYSNQKTLNGSFPFFPSWDFAQNVLAFQGMPLFVTDTPLFLRFTSVTTALNGWTATDDLRIWVLTSRLDQRT